MRGGNKRSGNDTGNWILCAEGGCVWMCLSPSLSRSRALNWQPRRPIIGSKKGRWTNPTRAGVTSGTFSRYNYSFPFTAVALAWSRERSPFFLRFPWRLVARWPLPLPLSQGPSEGAVNQAPKPRVCATASQKCHIICSL